MKLTFDWQSEPENSMLKSLLPHMAVHFGDELQEQLRVATSDWTDVALTIQVNGVDVPVQGFLDRFDDELTNVAVEAVDTNLNAIVELHSLKETIEQLEGEVVERVQAIARDNDVTWTRRDAR